MPKSFYARDLAITLFLSDNCQLLGLFKARNTTLVVHEFNGLYTQTPLSLQLAFYIDWKLLNKNIKAYTAFSGTLERNHESDILILDWLLVHEDSYYQEDSARSGSIILTSSYEDSEFLFTFNNACPFPQLDFVVDSVNN